MRKKIDNLAIAGADDKDGYNRQDTHKDGQVTMSLEVSHDLFRAVT